MNKESNISLEVVYSKVYFPCEHVLGASDLLTKICVKESARRNTLAFRIETPFLMDSFRPGDLVVVIFFSKDISGAGDARRTLNVTYSIKCRYEGRGRQGYAVLD